MPLEGNGKKHLCSGSICWIYNDGGAKTVLRAGVPIEEGSGH